MSLLTDALDELLAQHHRIGSPVPAYLRPGQPAEQVRKRIAAVVGVDPPLDVIELFTRHDGIDDERWEKDDVATCFARLFGDSHFAPLGDAVREYRERIETDRTTATYAPDGAALETWKRSWFPVLCGGWDTYAIDCDPASPDRGRIFDPAWDPPVGVGAGPRFRDLLHLVRSAVRRFDAGGYTWDTTRFLDEHPEILAPLDDREVAEARG
jgi:hypothetical protein